MRETLLAPPHGLDEIIMTFGDVAASTTADGDPSRAWRRRFLTRIDLPFGMPLAWNESLQATRLTCHRRLGPVLMRLFDDLNRRQMRPLIQSFGGCYCFRRKRGGTELSTHAWGIALDLNPATNRAGTIGDMSPELVALFEQYGFEWGGRWSGRKSDPMHFQFCTGY